MRAKMFEKLDKTPSQLIKQLNDMLMIKAIPLAPCLLFETNYLYSHSIRLRLAF